MRTTAGDENLVKLLALTGPLLPSAELGEWTERARCTQAGPELWFPPKGDPGRHARGICARCEVRAQCLACATRADEHGIWGGLSRAERQRLLRRYQERHPAGQPAGKRAA